ncbi:sugar transferase [Secundilactobacillus collinoides]|uniref:Priming glycosyltransferase n=1 Tax=Secundilactobacillus collinoides DSM 20515 = JCM 1123 TaxID=1423733 RepID=A0A0R2BQP2_SECCO|nr:sugar transferase [Secundilactobacillus collinoides]KRM77916.1 priming glycosyltransferase [Secundilactobacillus collinoides DSM 20515 = JCM 1123]
MAANGTVNQPLKEDYLTKIKAPVHTPYLSVKTVLDVGLTLVLAIPAVFIIFVAFVVVKIDSHGPGFYRQERVGLMGQRFMVVKLRSMTVDAEVNGAQWAAESDSRITAVGRVLRKTRIDELPQLLNVLRGQMSLIGPRPERPEFTAEFSRVYPGFEQRLRIKPGLSGYAQVHGGYDLDPGQKAALDMHYIEHVSFRLDAEIFVDTIKTVLTGKGAR